jgi:hypothetical protein
MESDRRPSKAPAAVTSPEPLMSTEKSVASTPMASTSALPLTANPYKVAAGMV